MTGLEVRSLAERPDLVASFWSVPGGWPTFMLQDPVGDRCYARAVDLYPDLHLVGLLDGVVRARLHAVPISWPGLDALPATGWDWVLDGASAGRDDRAAISLVEARVEPASRSQGWSTHLLAAARERFAALGCHDLVGPVRPTGKSAEPLAPFDDYVRRRRADGLPADPWLRVHARLGGVVGPVAPLSMTVPGTLDQWRAWTGLPFDTSGPLAVDGGLVPVHVDTAQDHAVYVEPNVWVHHRL